MKTIENIEESLKIISDTASLLETVVDDQENFPKNAAAIKDMTVLIKTVAENSKEI